MGAASASAAPAASRFRVASDRAYLLVPAGNQGPGFLMLQNFRVIMKYNPAEAYALAIGHLADRLRGGEAFVQPWPRHEPVLTLAERRELQELLLRKGFDVGEPERPVRPQDPRRDPRLSGLGRAGSRRLCHRHDPGPPARPVSVPPPVTNRRPSG